MSDIKWDLAKKKQREEEIAAREKATEEKNALKVLAQVWGTWKRHLVKAPKTPQEVTAALYQLQNLVAEKGKGLSEHAKTFVLTLIEDKIAQTISLDVTERNMITQYVPNATYLVSTEGLPEAVVAPTQEDSISKDNLTSKPVQAIFREQHELESVPWIRKVMDQEAFAGLFVDGAYLCALFDDGEIIKLGVLANNTGTTKYPRGKELHDALAAREAGLGNGSDLANPAKGTVAPAPKPRRGTRPTSSNN